jgi:hypothetical protein
LPVRGNEWIKNTLQANYETIHKLEQLKSILRMGGKNVQDIIVD